MEQYPDSIVINVNSDATQDSNGNWVAVTGGTYTLDCRIEPNGAGRKIAGNDGILMDFAFNCYLPKMATIIPTGSAFIVTSLNNGTVNGNVKRASNGQLNSRLWL